MSKEKKLPLYDYRIKFDISSLPPSLKEAIAKIEEYSEKGDEFNYDIIFDMFEVDARAYLLKGRITEEEYKILALKYGGLFD